MTILKTRLTAQRLTLIPTLGLALVLQGACGRVDDQLVAQTPTRAMATDGSYIHWSERLIDDEGLSGLALRGADGFEVADFDKDGFADVAIMYEDSFHLRLAFGSANPDQWQLVTLSAGTEVQEIAINGDRFIFYSRVKSTHTTQVFDLAMALNHP
ncbi:MAG: hypothetical protein HOC23_21785 [Halieaceae bacterium]|jgi:hypothetical protein|nr:hypothetical protein [Halieaceae bacterium]